MEEFSSFDPSLVVTSLTPPAWEEQEELKVRTAMTDTQPVPACVLALSHRIPTIPQCTHDHDPHCMVRKLRYRGVK